MRLLRLTSRRSALIPLAANGYDWVATRDQTKLFVSVPDRGQIAVIDTIAWEVAKYLGVGIKPTRLALQPDRQYLWVAGGGDSQSSFAAFRIGSLELAGRQTIGNGNHAITVSRDSNFVFVTNGEDNTVSVIDNRTLKSVTNIQVGQGPASVAYSELANAVYVSLTDALNEIVQAGRLGKAPFQVSFSNNYAYVIHILAPAGCPERGGERRLQRRIYSPSARSILRAHPMRLGQSAIWQPELYNHQGLTQRKG
jgi:YVTN family beta-propeller protein